jgi:hypothetical protein
MQMSAAYNLKSWNKLRVRVDLNGIYFLVIEFESERYTLSATEIVIREHE